MIFYLFIEFLIIILCDIIVIRGNKYFTIYKTINDKLILYRHLDKAIHNISDRL
jgi:hypothetical protein